MDWLEAFGFRLQWWEALALGWALRLLPMIGYIDRFENTERPPATPRQAVAGGDGLEAAA